MVGGLSELLFNSNDEQTIHATHCVESGIRWIRWGQHFVELGVIRIVIIRGEGF